MSNQKTLITRIWFHSGFKIKTSNDGDESVYNITMKDDSTFKCYYWFTPEGEACVSIEHSINFEGRDKIKFDNVISKLNKVEGLTVSVEDLRQPISVMNNEVTNEVVAE